MYLSVVIPAFNEELRIIPTISDSITYLRKQNYEFEVIVVDDGSIDNTKKVVLELQKQFPELSLESLEKNQGKGTAVKAGMLKAAGQLHLFMDADGSTQIREIEKLLPYINNDFDIVIGSRALNGNVVITTSIHRRLMGRIFNFFVNMLALPSFYDTQCGFKLFSAKSSGIIFNKQQEKGFSFDVEILLLAVRNGFKIKEVAVNWHNVAGSKVSLVNDSLKMFWDILRISFRN